MRRTLTAFSILLSLILPRALRAQDSIPAPAESPTTSPAPAADPFRAGQWAAQFGVGGGFVGIGALHFTSPDDAHALRANLRFDDAGNGSDYKEWSAFVDAGRRHYGPLRGRVRSTREWGLFGGTAYRRVPTVSGAVTQKSYSAGLYGELGAQVFVARDLSIGAIWSGSVGYSHYSADYEGGPDERSDTIGFSVGAVYITGVLYF